MSKIDERIAEIEEWWNLFGINDEVRGNHHLTWLLTQLKAARACIGGIQCDGWAHHSNATGQPYSWELSPHGRICEDCEGTGKRLVAFDRSREGED